MDTVLVTGACGLIGEKTCSGLLKKGYRVVGVDRQPSNYNAGKENYVFYETSPAEGGKYGKIFDDEQIDIVVHLACSVDNDFGHIITEEEVELSRKCDKFIYKYALSKEVKKFVLLSTSQIYEIKKTREPVREDADTKPITNYAKLKNNSEVVFANDVRNTKKMVCAIVRATPVYTSEYYENLVAKITDPKDGKAFMYLGGDYGFQFCCLHNLVDFILCFAKQAEDTSYTGIYNVCDTNLTSAIDIVNFMRSNHKLGPVVQKSSNPAKDVIASIIGKIKKSEDEKTNYRYLDYGNLLNNNMFDNKKAAKLCPFRWNIRNTK